MMGNRMPGRYETDEIVDPVLGILRRCTFCGKYKPLDEFASDGITATGEPKKRLDCKVCYNLRRKENHHTKAHTDFIGGMKRRGEADPQFTHQDWKDCLIYFDGSCAYCGKTPKRGERLTKDHLLSCRNGGLTRPDNIVPACDRCNSSKGPLDFKEWFMAQSFFSQDRLNKIFKWRTIMRLTMPANDPVNTGREN
jgi:5-methylcytosine-specific restriction endonuclease McrA